MAGSVKTGYLCAYCLDVILWSGSNKWGMSQTEWAQYGMWCGYKWRVWM